MWKWIYIINKKDMYIHVETIFNSKNIFEDLFDHQKKINYLHQVVRVQFKTNIGWGFAYTTCISCLLRLGSGCSPHHIHASDRGVRLHQMYWIGCSPTPHCI